jgi:hypothetical protein
VKIYAMFGVYKHADSNTPELVGAWDEYSRDENPDGYADEYEKWAADGDLKTFTVVTVEVDEQAVRGALFPPAVEVTGKIVDDRKAGAR